MITALVQCVLDKVDCLFSFHFSVGQTVQGSNVDSSGGTSILLLDLGLHHINHSNIANPNPMLLPEMSKFAINGSFSFTERIFIKW